MPFLGELLSEDEMQKFFTGRITSYRNYFIDALKNSDKEKIEKAAIKVEKIRSPILLVSGSDDQTWPSKEYSEMIKKRLKMNKFKYEVKHITGLNAGHHVFLPDFITATYRNFNGGSREAELHWSIVSWEETIKFLHKYLD